MTDRTQFAVSSGLIIGIALAVLGLGAWVLTDFASLTALIPTLFGILVVIVASLGRQDTGRERLVLSGLGVLGALAVLGSLRAVPDIIAIVTGDEVDSVVAVVSQGAMIVCGLALVVVAGRALIE